MTRYTWLATTCPPSGAIIGTEYLGCVRADEYDGTVYWCAGRMVWLHGSQRHDWMEPFGRFESEGEAMAAYRQMVAEWDGELVRPEYQR